MYTYPISWNMQHIMYMCLLTILELKCVDAKNVCIAYELFQAG